jgi:hypothetical protein
VFRHVVLHAAVERRAASPRREHRSTQAVAHELEAAGYRAELAQATVRGLLKLVTKLHSRRADSAWQEYRSTCSYSDDDDAAKRRFVLQAVTARPRDVVLDLGANDGAYARLVAPSARTVVAIDRDAVVVDTLYRGLRADGPGNILPLVVDLTDPSPARGWRNQERSAFTSRVRPDLVLALALVHHLVIGGNVPMDEVVDWLASFGCPVVVELADADDPMVRRMLADKRAGQHREYGRARFEELLGRSFRITAHETLPSGSRTLYEATPIR